MAEQKSTDHRAHQSLRVRRSAHSSNRHVSNRDTTSSSDLEKLYSHSRTPVPCRFPKQVCSFFNRIPPSLVWTKKEASEGSSPPVLHNIKLSRRKRSENNSCVRPREGQQPQNVPLEELHGGLPDIQVIRNFCPADFLKEVCEAVHDQNDSMKPRQPHKPECADVHEVQFGFRKVTDPISVEQSVFTKISTEKSARVPTICQTLFNKVRTH